MKMPGPALLRGALAAALLLPASSFAHDPDPMEPAELLVKGSLYDLIGEAESASTGRISGDELRERPLLRVGEALETIPGLVVTQHSGAGKANQFFLRGFNLDHGTDFATFVEGMPINLRSHGHGQGYTDLNFMIPELIGEIDFRKGPYFADLGDFSSAGAAQIHYRDKLPHNEVSVSLGEYDFSRVVGLYNEHIGDGHLIFGQEAQYYNGPWEDDENFRRFNSVLKYAAEQGSEKWSVAAMAYYGGWDATDQIPQRAVDQGLISEFDSIDPTGGGYSQRFSLSGTYTDTHADSQTRGNFYAVYQRLSLFSNFTYFLDDPVDGDQFEQFDRRFYTGGQLSHTIAGPIAGIPIDHTFGTEIRHDYIPSVGLAKSKERERTRTIRDDQVNETSIGAYYSASAKLTDWWRTTAGVRGDYYFFDVNSDIEANSGNDSDGIINPKIGMVFGPWASTELYANAGLGFHSNDARGVTIAVDPNDPSTRADPVDPLVRSRGAEVGVRTSPFKDFTSTFSFWGLKLDSELLFVGDAGTTEASRPSERYGFEWSNEYRFAPYLYADVDWSISRARFDDDAPEGDEIPGSIENVVNGGVHFAHPSGIFGSIRSRYFGPRPLIEDDSVRSQSTILWNSSLGHRWDKHEISLECLNMFDADSSDIDYFYESRLPGEPDEGVSDIHFHPVEPRMFRVKYVLRF